MTTEYAPFDPDEDAYMAAEQQRDMEEHHEYIDATLNQLYRHVATGMTGTGDLVSISILARELGCTVPNELPSQPRDYAVGGTTDE